MNIKKENLSNEIKNYLSNILNDNLILITSLSIILTQFVQQDFSLITAYLKSDYSLLQDYSVFKNSVFYIIANIFNNFNFKPKFVTIIISIGYSIIAISALIVFSKTVKNINPMKVCYTICLLYFLEKLRLFNSGLNYPMTIISPNFNSVGSFGLIFSILTISIFLLNSRFKFIFIAVNLFVHASLGLLALSYLFLISFLKKRYSDLVMLILICISFIFFNYNSDISMKEEVVKFIHLNDFHRMPLEINHFKFLIFPIFLTLLHSNKKDLIIEWMFIFICISISYFYYNLEFNFLQLPFLSLMPSRGANIGVALIIIKFSFDIINNPKNSKFVFLILFSIISNQILYSHIQLTSVFIGSFTGLLVISLSNLYQVKLQSIKSPRTSYQIKKKYFIYLLLSFIIYLNILSASVNINQMVFGKPRAYDNFFSLLKKKTFYIDLTFDPFIMQRNKNMVELLPLSAMDGFCWQPAIFKKANIIFNALFSKNLWDLDLQNRAFIKYDNCKNILETYGKENWNKLKGMELNYLICPVSSKIKLKRVWEDENYVIFKL